MMFTALYEDNKLIGWQHEDARRIFFFGSKHSTLETIKLLYPNHRRARIHQVHGKILVPAQDESDSLVKADAHWTDTPAMALFVQTADCIPALISTDSSAMALHLGWRGLASGLLQEGLQHLIASSRQAIELAIGPHILAESFEVGKDVALEIFKATDTSSKEFSSPHPDANKVFVDLAGILETITLRLAPGAHIHRLDLNTLTHPDLHSYRRSGGEPGRQWSFVALMPRP